MSDERTAVVKKTARKSVNQQNDQAKFYRWAKIHELQVKTKTAAAKTWMDNIIFTAMNSAMNEQNHKIAKTICLFIYFWLAALVCWNNRRDYELLNLY